MSSCCSMQRGFYGFVICLAVGGAIMLSNTINQASAAKDEVVRSLRHVVLFKFKSTSSEEDVKKVVDEFRRLPSRISEIADFEFGTNNSPEGLADGFTHCFFLTFKNEKDRDIYLKHAAHTAFVDVLKPHLEKATVLDYFAGK